VGVANRALELAREALGIVGASIDLASIGEINDRCSKFYEGAFCEVRVKYKNREGEARTLTIMVLIRDNPPE